MREKVELLGLLSKGCALSGMGSFLRVPGPAQSIYEREAMQSLAQRGACTIGLVLDFKAFLVGHGVNSVCSVKDRAL